MKAVYVFVFAATLLLVIKSTGLFATTKNCSTVACCCTPNKDAEIKKTASDITEFEPNPFTILIPGNHF